MNPMVDIIALTGKSAPDVQKEIMDSMTLNSRAGRKLLTSFVFNASVHLIYG